MLRASALLGASSLVLLTLACLACSSGATSEPGGGPAPAPAPPAPVAKIQIERDVQGLRESGALVLARVAGAERAFVADEDDRAILEVDVDKEVVVSATSIASRPRDLLVLADGRLAVTLPDDAAVAIFSRDVSGALHEDTRVRTPAEPLALAVDGAEATLYVSTGASHALVAFTTSSFEERARFTLGREPRAVLVSSDGERVFVTHAIESFVSVVPAAGKTGAIEERPTGNHSACSGGGMCAGARTARSAQAIARVGDGVVIPAAQALPVEPGFASKSFLCRPAPRINGSITPAAAPAPKQGYGGSGAGEQGPTVTNDVATFDGATGKYYGSGTPAIAAPTCLLPRAAAALGDDVLVACLGSARIARFKPRRGFDFHAVGKPHVEGYPTEGLVATVTVDAIAVPAGPTGLAIARDAKHALVWSSFARALTRIDTATSKQISSFELPRQVKREVAWLRGRELFFTNGDKRIAADGRACATCHIDGLDDDLTWKTPLGLRHTRMLSGELASGPYGWKGEHATLEEHVKATISNLSGKGLPDEELASLLGYVKSLSKRPASPSTDAEATRGKELFSSAECASCHTGGSSDRMLHDIGTGGAFMTPTLASIGTRGDLMHDGRYRTLDQLLASASNMGRGSSLSADERRALVRYLETL